MMNMKILHILSALDDGGVEHMITDYYSNFPCNDIVFDFAVHGNKEGILEKKIIKMGSKIYHLTPKRSSFIKNFRELWNVIRKKNYDAIYCHQNYSSFLPLLIGLLKGIRIRVVHSHGINNSKGMYEKISKSIIKLSATHFFACSNEAAKCLYGKKWKESFPKNVIVTNAIDVNRFLFSNYDRSLLRKKYNLNDKICLLHIGRFTYEKNHKFIIDILSKLSNNYYLVLIGTGELKKEIIEYSKEKKVYERITFISPQKNIEKFYSMADIFIFPSIAEGFGIVSLEAQANGLPVLASTFVPNNTDFGLIKYLPLNSIDVWINQIKKSNRNIDDNKEVLYKIRNKGFCIKEEANKFYNLLKLIKGEK